MSALEGFEVMEKVPGKVRTKTVWNTREVVEAFLESGNECMGKRYPDDRETRNAYMSFYLFIKRHGLPIMAVKRGKMVILVREEA